LILLAPKVGFGAKMGNIELTAKNR